MVIHNEETKQAKTFIKEKNSYGTFFPFACALGLGQFLGFWWVLSN
jgi:hypothetical protein